MDLKGKTALLTGAARGIGLATAKGLAAEGARVLLVDINPQVEVEAARLRDGGAEAAGFVCDLADDAAVKALGERVTEAHGTPDLVFNIAYLPTLGSLDQPVMDDWRKAFEVNVFGYVRIAAAFTPGMIARGSGHLINTVSPMGLLPGGAPGFMLPYCACKGADIGLTGALAVALQPHGVGVSIFYPALTASWAGTPPGAVPDAFKEGLRQMVMAGATVESSAEALLAGLKADQYMISAEPGWEERLVKAAAVGLDPRVAA